MVCCLGPVTLPSPHATLLIIRQARPANATCPSISLVLELYAYLSTSSNLRHHQNQRATPCSPSDNITATRQVQGKTTGRLRSRTREERLERDHDRKRLEYWCPLNGQVRSPSLLSQRLPRAAGISSEGFTTQARPQRKVSNRMP